MQNRNIETAISALGRRDADRDQYRATQRSKRRATREIAWGYTTGKRIKKSSS